MKLKFILIGLILIVTHSLSQSIIGKKAPSFEVDTWIQTYKQDLDINDFKNKVVYIYGFQSWCPGCHSHGFPTLNELSKYYKYDSDVKFVAIQTTFEGFSTNDIQAAKDIIKRYNLTMPVAQSGLEGLRSKFMINYNTGGTPWTIIVDKNGIVRFSNFHLTSREAVTIIDKLKK
jgi:thiol-disulfide isomerase/thioredoxin